LNQINAKLVSLEGTLATVQTNFGTVTTDLDNILLKVVGIEGDMVTMSSVLGDLNGTLLSIQGDIALIKLVSPGPAVFRQERTGLGGVRFTLFKLRTMRLDAQARQAELCPRNEVDGPAFKIAADPRVIRFGRFLRTSSIDELPQFWNVLRGDMSLLGPRPLPCHESDDCLPWHRRRLDVTPGMSGLWQVSGRSRIPFDAWVRMDLEYARTRSPLRDLLLLARTIPAVLFRRGAS